VQEKLLTSTSAVSSSPLKLRLSRSKACFVRSPRSFERTFPVAGAPISAMWLIYLWQERGGGELVSALSPVYVLKYSCTKYQ
jgi:hypothetical protein